MRLFLSIILGSCFSLTAPSPKSATFVYICTGKSAYSYHRTDACSGLNNCQASIKKVTIEYAKSIKRRPCKKCY